MIFYLGLGQCRWSLEFGGGLECEERILPDLSGSVDVWVSVCHDGLTLSERKTNVLSLVVVCILINHCVGPASKLTRMQALFTLSVCNLTAVAIECIVGFVLAYWLVGYIALLYCILWASGRCLFEEWVIRRRLLLDLHALVFVKLARATKFVCRIQISLSTIYCRWILYGLSQFT